MLTVQLLQCVVAWSGLLNKPGAAVPIIFEEDSANILSKQQAILIQDIVFQQIGELHPHESNLLVRTDLSYAALEAVPQKTESIADILEELADNLTRAHELDPVPEPTVLPRYEVFDKGARLNIRQARLRCKTKGMRLLAPADVKELKEAGSYYISNYPTSKHTRIWIDTEFDIQSAQLVNPVNKKPLAIIYKNVQPLDKWEVKRDDHFVAIALNPQVGNLEFLTIKGLGESMNSNQWYWATTQSTEPEASYICQGFNIEGELITLKGEIADARQLYARENARLPRQEIRETEKIFRVMAQEQRRRFKQLIERYDLQQPLLGDTPEKERVKSTPMRPLQITIRGPNRTFIVSSGTKSGQLKVSGPKSPFRVTATHAKVTRRRTKRDIGEHLLINIGKSIPLVGPFIGSVSDVLKEKRHEAFRDATGKGLRHLYREVTSQAQEIKAIRFAEKDISLQILTIQNEVSYLNGILGDVALYLEVNAVVDRLRTKALATHSEFLVQAEKFERWINAMLKGHSPEDLYRGEVLKELRNVVAQQGLNVKAQFQDTESMILPHENRTQSVVILSSIRATSPPWAIYQQRSVPRFYGNRLFREKLAADYIAINPKYNQYIPLDREQVRECRDKICRLAGPIRALAHAECGTRALVGNSEDSPCPIHEIPYTEEFIELSEGGLLFSVKNPVQITITCPFEESPNIQHETLVGRGVLFIRPKCQVAFSNGDMYPGPTGSTFITQISKEVIKLAVDTTGLDRLKDDIESIVQLTDKAIQLTSNGPQIALFTAVVIIAIALATLCCYVAHIKKYAARLRGWISPWAAHRTPPSSVGQHSRNGQRGRGGCARRLKRYICCGVDREFTAGTPIDMSTARHHEHAAQQHCTTKATDIDSLLATDGSPMSNPIRSAMLSGGMTYPQTNNSSSNLGGIKTSSPFGTTATGERGIHQCPQRN